MLIVALDTSKKEPLYEQIYNSIKEEIITGVLPFGARLPSARRLSKHLDVSRNTVVQKDILNQNQNVVSLSVREKNWQSFTFQLRLKKRKKKYDQRRYHTTFHQQELIWNSFLIISGENY